MRHPMLSIMSARIRTLKELTDAGIPRSTIASRCRSGRWLRLYRRDLAPHTVSTVTLLPAVSPAQALFDCAVVMPERDVASLVDAELNRSVDPDEFRDLCLTHRGRHGMPAARRLLRHASLRAASEPERVLGRELSVRGFALAPNLPIGPYVGDFVDERARIVVEVDGREFHSEPEVFRGDRRRQNWLVREGWMVLRFAAYDVLAHPDAIADEITAAVN